tara:strand:- start:54 stop:353 length:300 start_codon:yes stop_codon:yes gene_type:complete
MKRFVETVEESVRVFLDNGIDAAPHSKCYYLIIVTNDNGMRFQYYPTTGRWGAYTGRSGTRFPHKHYSSKDTQQFIDKWFKTTKHITKGEVVHADTSNT